MMRELLVFFVVTLVIFDSECGGIQGPITANFQSWLQKYNYTHYDFIRKDYGNYGSYGGFPNSTSKITRPPVIFFHGNSDSALKTDSFSTGWDNSIAYFLSKGYQTGELYATSWQDNLAIKAGTRTHDCSDLQRLRKFVEAVIRYTKTTSISIIGHSMGVTLSRKIIQGGIVNATDGNCDLGVYLGDYVDVFIGISGANYGLCSCTGTFSGDSCGTQTVSSHCGNSNLNCTSSKYSSYLNDLNNFPTKIAKYVFSMWSRADDLINNQDYVWGRNTSMIPMSDAKIVFEKYTHMQSKELTAADQYSLVVDKNV
ncbi:unnamed protein product [Caenorhabditis angaria]|uniref:Lipase n=1 Tax=Caenorhabditis angaria TaxID=860376 RepID=A0A9P1IXK5_9PELO|nr:unnamed protein product [Caenorhabditis angaria]